MPLPSDGRYLPCVPRFEVPDLRDACDLDAKSSSWTVKALGRESRAAITAPVAGDAYQPDGNR